MVFLKMVIPVTFVKVFFLLSLFVDNWKPWLAGVDIVESCMQNWFQNFEIYICDSCTELF